MTDDVHSFAEPENAVVKHLDLNLTVDFDKKILSGYAALDIENKASTDVLILDTRDLKIKKVYLNDSEETSYVMGEPVQYLGQSMKIKIKPNTKKVRIEYSTSPAAAALQWLSPAQTAGGSSPFLFTQSQSILARSWIPLQDSPGIKFTYSAAIKCPPALMALMSAENDTLKHADGVYKFKMPQPVPAYLMALAVGDIDFHSYAENCGIFAEPALINKAAYEFADLPKMISAAEELYGKYRWGRYDVLVLPPSFPFGGMENPRLTFATPTVIAGDRSLVSLIAHELAHSWSGNLVTNATWNDFWLNEGFTVYFENRIMEKIYGTEYSNMLSAIELDELKKTIKEMGADNADTKLFLNLKNRDPDEAVTDIAYDKGRFFLEVIEKAVGRDKWDAFVKKYFNAYAFQSMTTVKFLEYLNTELIKDDAELKEKTNIEAWVYGTGLPQNCPSVISHELDKAAAAASAFMNGVAASKLDTAGWTTHHWLHFLRNLNDSLALNKMKELDQAFNFTKSNNSEIQADWYLLAITHQYAAAFPLMENFLIKVGRRKFLKPLYKEMSKTPSGLQMAQEIYRKARPGYHAVSTQTIDEILKWKADGNN